MNMYIRLSLAVLLVLGTSLGYGRLLLNPKITRKRFALVISCLIGIMFFGLSIIFGGFSLLAVGIVLFILCIPGIYPISYLAYPIIKNRAENQQKTK